MRFNDFSMLLARRYMAALGGLDWLAHILNCFIDAFNFLFSFAVFYMLRIQLIIFFRVLLQNMSSCHYMDIDF